MTDISVFSVADRNNIFVQTFSEYEFSYSIHILQNIEYFIAIALLFLKYGGLTCTL